MSRLVSTSAPLNTPEMRTWGCSACSMPGLRDEPSIGRKRDVSRSCGMSSVSSRLAMVIESPSICPMIPYALAPDPLANR